MTTIQFIPSEDDGDDDKVVSVFFGETIVKTTPEIEFADLWNVNTIDWGQPNERPAYSEECYDGTKCFTSEHELIEWMGKFGLVKA
jgi:hypothetical protein